MGLINWIFDIYQHSKIDDARQEAAQARLEAAAIRNSSGGIDTAHLEQAIGELALATKTLQRLLIDKGFCTPQEFGAMLTRIDHEDGTADGRAPVR